MNAKGRVLGGGRRPETEAGATGGQIRKYDDMYVVCMKMLCENLLLWYFNIFN